MRAKKPAATLAAGAVALESVLTDPEHRKLPHAHDPEHRTPRAVATFAIERQSTASSHIVPLTGPNIRSTGTQLLRGGQRVTFGSSGWFTASN